MTTFRFAVNVLPRDGILDPQGRAVEQSLGHLDVRGVSGVRVGRRVELSVEAADEASGRAVVERLADELLANPLIEQATVELLPTPSSTAGAGAAAVEAGSPAVRAGSAAVGAGEATG